jgi:ketosteroid isomerase-like protein
MKLSSTFHFVCEKERLMTPSAPRPGIHASPREVWECAMECVKGTTGYDHDAFAAMFAEDGVFDMPFAPPGMPNHLVGREEIARVLKPAGQRSADEGRETRGIGSVVVYETIDPEQIVVEYEVTVENTKLGNTYTIPYIQVVRVRAGEIVQLRDFWSPLAPGIAEAIETMGAVPDSR